MAVIGSGPAGLMAGYQLARRGYDVTIFEALDVPGGALVACIPEYRLPREMLDADIQYIKNSGVKIRTGVRIGKDIAFDDLVDEYRAVFIATGAHKSRKMNVPGEDTPGVLDAMEFLRRVNLKQPLDIGRRVAVVGGGNAAVDAARVAVRQWKAAGKSWCSTAGAGRKCPPFHEEVDGAIAEGVEFQFLAAPVKVLAANGKAQRRGVRPHGPGRAGRKWPATACSPGRLAVHHPAGHFAGGRRRAARRGIPGPRACD